MGYTFQSAWFPDVRIAIGQGVTELTLPDATLASVVFKTETENFMNRQFTAEQLANALWVDELRVIATLYMASLAAPTVRLVDAERIAGGNLTYAKTDMEALARSLYERANSRIGSLIQTDVNVADTFPASAIFMKAHRKDLWRP